MFKDENIVTSVRLKLLPSTVQDETEKKLPSEVSGKVPSNSTSSVQNEPYLNDKRTKPSPSINN